MRLSPYILQATDSVLAHFMSRVAYLAPLRVSAERAYRVTNLAVDEVDPDGKNLAMLLCSTPEVESFATFTREALGFETQVRTIACTPRSSSGRVAPDGSPTSSTSGSATPRCYRSRPCSGTVAFDRRLRGVRRPR